MSDDLDENSDDKLAIATKAIWASVPVAGPLLSEAVGQLIPINRLDRVVSFIRDLSERIEDVEINIEVLKENLKNEHGLDLLEQALIQSGRLQSEQKREALINILVNSLTQEQLNYSEAEHVLFLLRDLNAHQLVTLKYYSEPVGIKSAYHIEMRAKYPEILSPRSRPVGKQQKYVDETALHDSYEATLMALGLLKKETDTRKVISTLGKLVLNYIES